MNAWRWRAGELFIHLVLGVGHLCLDINVRIACWDLCGAKLA